MNGTSTLTWFKLPTALIIQPKFQRLSAEAQAGFVTLCCVYWQDGGVLTYEDAKLNAEGIDELISKGYVVEDDGLISIEFLDEQIAEVDEEREKKRAAGRKSAQARAQQKASKASTGVEQVLNECSAGDEQRREEEIREEKTDRQTERREGQQVADALEFDSDGNEVEQPTTNQPKTKAQRARFQPPTEQDVELFFQTTTSPQSWEAFYNYYLANGWRVGRNPMKDWKAAARNWVNREKQYNKPNTQTNGNRTNAESIAHSLANQIANGEWNILKD